MQGDANIKAGFERWKQLVRRWRRGKKRASGVWRLQLFGASEAKNKDREWLKIRLRGWDAFRFVRLSLIRYINKALKEGFQEERCG